MIDLARQGVLEKAGLPAPSPQMVRALIDTGASISAVDPIVLSALGLQQTGEADIHTPSTGGVSVKFPTFDVRIAILAGREGDLHFISDTVQVTGSNLSQFGFSVLIGTDILKKCILYYNGADEVFSLAW
jgi:predicted aspartyl protease